MADRNALAELLFATYGQGYTPDLGGDGVYYDTADVLRRRPAANPVSRGLRNLADYIPAYDDPQMRRGGDEDWLSWWARTNNQGSLPNFLMQAGKGALGTAANWLDWKPEIGPDTLAPLGLAGVGVAPMGALAANALRRSPGLPAVWRAAHTRTSVEGRTAGEGIANSALRIGDDLYVAPTHLEAIEAAASKNPDIWSHFSKPGTVGVDDGFVTNTGRYLDRYEATALARAVNDPAKRSFREFMDSTDLPHVGPFSRGAIFADSSRSSLPGTVVNAAEQSGKPRYEIGPNLHREIDDPSWRAQGMTPFWHKLYRDGEKFGSASGHITGDTAELSWIGATGQANRLGPSGIRELRELFRQLYPDVKTFEGVRSSGSRRGKAASSESPDRQSVRLPAVTGLPLPAQEPPTLAELLAQYGMLGVP